MRPAWSISADGEDVTARLADYLLRLTISDRSGMEPDELALEIADPLAQVALPRLGATLSVAVGYAHSGTTPMGDYVVDTVELSHPPRQIAVRARSADLRGSLKTRKTRSFEAQTLGAVVGQIASEHGLTPAVSTAVSSGQLARIEQTNESDISLLTRVGQLFDALVSVKSGRLIVAPRGQGQTVSGQPMSEIALVPADLTSWRISLSEAERYTAVEARYYDVANASEEWVRAGSGNEEATYRIRGTHPDRARAQAAANSKLTALTRGETTFDATLPGRTDLAAETPVVLQGVASELDGRWILTEVAHRLGSEGYACDITGERA